MSGSASSCGRQLKRYEEDSMKIFILGAGLLAAALAFGQTANTGGQLRNMDKQMRDAALRGDSSLDEKYLAKEYVAINSAGVLTTREQLLARLKSNDVKLQAIDVEQEEVHVCGETAVITGHERVRGTFQDHPFDNSAIYSRVWTKQHSEWKLILFQETPLRQAGQ
jgi:hypothetical protein